MIRGIARWFGLHPVTCLIPAGIFGILAICEVVARWGGKTLMHPYGYIVALGCILASLAVLAVGLAVWVRNTMAGHLHVVLTELERRLTAQITAILAHMVQEHVYNRRTMAPVPSWNGDTESGRVYGDGGLAVAASRPPTDVFGQIVQNEYGIDPPTGDVAA